MSFRKSLIALSFLVCGLVVVPSIYADPAIVIKNTGVCGMPGADGDGNIIFGGLGVQTTKVENDTKVMLKCKGEGITNSSGKGQSFQGFGCGVPIPSGGFGFTSDTHATVSASGVGTLTCTIQK